MNIPQIQIKHIARLRMMFFELMVCDYMNEKYWRNSSWKELPYR